MFCGTTFKFEYLGEFKIETKNILEHESGAHMGLIHEKNRGQKSRATVPLKVPKHEIFDFDFFASKEPIWSTVT